MQQNTSDSGVNLKGILENPQAIFVLSGIGITAATLFLKHK